MTACTPLLETHAGGQRIETYELTCGDRVEYRTIGGTMRVTTWTATDAYDAHQMVVGYYEAAQSEE